MKRIFLLLFVCCLFVACSNQEQGTTILTGNINLTTGTPSGNLHIGLHPYSPYRIYSYPIQFLAQKETTFQMKVKPGKYTLAIYALEFEPFTLHLLIPDDKSQIKIDITLPPLGIEPDFKNVIINGRFCNWNWEEGKPLIRRGDVWVLTDTSIIKPGEPYRFYVDGLMRNDLREKKTKIVRDWAFLDNLYQGGEIIFDPSLYIKPRQEPTSGITGNPITAGFSELSKDLAAFHDDFRQVSRKIRIMPPEEQNTAFDSIFARLEQTEKRHDPALKQIFLEEKLGLLPFWHPTILELRRLWQTGQPDSAQLAQFYSSQQFQAYFSEIVNLLKQIDPKSQLLDGNFIQALTSLESGTADHPEILAQQNLPKDFFETFINNFLAKSTNDRCREQILVSLAGHYLHADKPEKAEFYLDKLEKEYPETEFIKQGYAQKIRNSLKIQVGADAPLFAVQTLKGDSLRLADLKGKFVFIDFWGSWCGPCRGEIPNVKKLAQEIPSEKLQVIGLARDDLKSLTAYIEAEKIEYPNAIASEKVLTQYGISAFPTTFLISPDGKIVAKNLRDDNLTSLVKEKMSGVK